MLLWINANVGIITLIVGILTVFAIFRAPVVALKIQENMEDYKEKKQRKLNVFKTLMGTRAARVSPDHVQALNMIDIEFYGIKKINDAWGLYRDHLNNGLINDKNPNELKSWIDKGEDLLIDLLFEISKEVGYDFDKVLLKRGIYSPRAHGELEIENNSIRKGLMNFLQGKQTIPINISTDKTKSPLQDTDKK